MFFRNNFRHSIGLFLAIVNRAPQGFLITSGKNRLIWNPFDACARRSFPAAAVARRLVLDLLIETLEGLDVSVRGQFLRQYFRTIAQIDLSETQSNEYWQRILTRRRELTESLGRPVSLETAMVDVLVTTNFFRVPILMEN